MKITSNTEDITLAALLNPLSGIKSTPPRPSTRAPPSRGAMIFPKAKQMLNSEEALSATPVKFSALT